LPDAIWLPAKLDEVRTRVAGDPELIPLPHTPPSTYRAEVFQRLKLLNNSLLFIEESNSMDTPVMDEDAVQECVFVKKSDV
jgi:hypothetical protein